MAGEIQNLVTAQEELLRMTSHELRTPIQRLHFGLEHLRSAHGPAREEEALDRMEADLTELDELIEELLTYVRLKDSAAPARERVEVFPVLEELCDTSSRMSAGVTLAGPRSTESPLAVAVEARLLRRAISNLIVNALRHARSRVEVSLTREGSRVHVHVDDDGPGIPQADRERIFEPFQRLDDERTRRSKGSGLGLAIVRRIAETHGGDISALTSELGGARFQLSLPPAPGSVP
jgi:signal transduction histidine kinase